MVPIFQKSRANILNLQKNKLLIYQESDQNDVNTVKLNIKPKVLTIFLLISCSVLAFAAFSVLNKNKLEKLHYKNYEKEILNYNHDFKNASAIYIENKFIGAAENESILNSILDNELNKYKNIAKSTNFKEELKIVNGVYPTSEILKKDQLQEKLFKTAKTNSKKNNEKYISSNNDRILNVEYTVRKEKNVSIPFKILEKKVSDKPISFRKIECLGKIGKELRTQEETYVNDKLIKTVLLNCKTTQAPIDKVVLVGSQVQNKKLIWPLPFTKQITSKFGMRSGKFHKGIDIADKNVINKEIIASHDGIVSFAGTCKGYGKLIKITSNNKIENYEKIVSLYAHCKKFLVNQGQKIKSGQKIATVGNSGDTTGPHLHFELEVDGKNVNPINLI